MFFGYSSKYCNIPKKQKKLWGLLRTSNLKILLFQPQATPDPEILTWSAFQAPSERPHLGRAMTDVQEMRQAGGLGLQ